MTASWPGRAQRHFPPLLLLLAATGMWAKEEGKRRVDNAAIPFLCHTLSTGMMAGCTQAALCHYQPARKAAGQLGR